MHLFGKSIAISLLAMTAGYANAGLFVLDRFDDSSIAETTMANNTDSDTVTDSTDNDLFATRDISLSSTGANTVANIQADMSITDGLSYAAETSVKAIYEIAYVLDAPTDLTGGKGVVGPDDALELFVLSTDFRAQFEARINGGQFSVLGEIPASVGITVAPGIVEFSMNSFAGDLTSVSSVEFRITPLDFNGNVAAAADGSFSFARFNLETPPIVPTPSSILLLAAGFLGLRKMKKSA